MQARYCCQYNPKFITLPLNERNNYDQIPISAQYYNVLTTVPQFTISPRNVTVIEGVNSTVEVCVSRVGVTALARNVVVTVQTGPKTGSTAQATGIYMRALKLWHAQ
jgi:hypothetical protein